MDHNWRYEIKYVIEARHIDQLLVMLRHHPAGFSKQYPARQIHNIYLDTPEMNKVNENLDGISQRTKYRIRWYDDRFDNLVLESKIKSNSLGRKEYHHIASIDGYKLVNNGYLNHLVPTVRNTYQRSYFVDNSERFRLTVDSQIQYDYGDSVVQTIATPISDRIILELKFDQKHSNEFQTISDHISYRVTKHSKYVNGILQLYY